MESINQDVGVPPQQGVGIIQSLWSPAIWILKMASELVPPRNLSGDPHFG
ncbi:MAG: hypothetical protein ACO2O0_01000 [Desulfurococcales archaeon]